MVSFFKDRRGELPGGDQRGPSTDVSTWRNIQVRAQRLVTKCVLEENKFGWSRTGMKYPSVASVP